MENIFLQMAIIFVIMATGFVANKLKSEDHTFDLGLSSFIMSVSCPALILSSVCGDELPDKELVVPLLITGLISYLVVFVLSVLGSRLFSKDKDIQGIYTFMLVFGNVGFIGYPVVASLFGPQAVFFAAVLNFANSLFMFSAGMGLISGQRFNLRHIDFKFLYNPNMVASYLAILAVMFDIHPVPAVISEPLRMVGSITVPGALLIIGSSIAQMPLRRMSGSPGVYALCLLRLIVLPLFVYFLSWLICDSAVVIKVNTVLFAMPVATLGTMLCLLYHKDDTLMTQGIFLSTLLSLLSIPCITLLIDRLNMLLQLN